MLVIGRTTGESLSIGKAGDILKEPIVVTLCEAKRCRAKLGVVANGRDGEINVGRVDAVVSADELRALAGM